MHQYGLCRVEPDWQDFGPPLHGDIRITKNTGVVRNKYIIARELG